MAVQSRIYIVEGVKISLDVLKAVASVLPGPMSDVLDLAQKVIEISETMQSSREDCATIRMRILQLLPVIMMAAKKDTKNDKGHVIIPPLLDGNIKRFQKNLEDTLETLTKINADVTSKGLRKKFKAFILSGPNAAAIAQCKDDLSWALSAFEASTSVASAVQLCELTAKIHSEFHDQRLETLPRSKYASHTSERPDRPSTCFEGTRTAVIDMIFNWIYDPDPVSDQIFFLNGIAGVGKTTIARTVAVRARRDGLLGGDFFFSRQGEADLRDASKVFPTLAYQLAHFDPAFGQSIVDALEKDPQAPFGGLKQQLDQLIINPLSKIQRDDKRTVVLVFDAFDECEPRGAKDILQLLLAAIPALPFFLKVFLTGRPEQHILSVLAKPTKGLATSALHDVEPLLVRNDIRLYVYAKLAELPGELGLDLAEGWAAEHEIELLIEKSGGLFIYTVTCLRFLSDLLVLNPRAQLDILMSIFQSNSPVPADTDPFRDLDFLYIQLLRTALSSTNTGYVLRTLQAVLGTIVVLRDPLPQRALEELASLQSGQATAPLRMLQSVILPAAPPDHCPRIYHPSFPDFVQDPNRCTEERFLVDRTAHEERLALACLKFIGSTLRKDMISDSTNATRNRDVEDLEAKVQAAYPPVIKYACRHWASHLQNSSYDNRSIAAALETFALRYLLLWIEAMSWLGETRSALKCLEIVKAWTSASTCSPNTKELIHDCHRLLLAHFPTIADSAPHITRSVVPFLPAQTLLAKTYHDSGDQTLQVVSGIESTWSPCLITIQAPRGIYSLAWSPDQSRLVCGTSEGQIRFMDAATGDHLGFVQMGMRSMIETILFSHDGSQVIFTQGMHDGFEPTGIRVFETATGRETTAYHHASVLCISPDGRRFASDFDSLSGKLVRVWNTGDGAVVKEWKYDSGPMACIKFSQDSRRLATGSMWTCCIEIWDVEIGVCVTKLDGHPEPVYCVTFSPDGRFLAAGSSDETIRIWDLKFPSNSASVLRGHSGDVFSLEFSPNSQNIISGSRDQSVILWNIPDGEVLGVFTGHTSGIKSVVWSPDGKQVASGSPDGSVRIWDITIRPNENPAPPKDEPPGDIVCLSFSTDGTRVASAFDSGMVQISSGTNTVDLKKQSPDRILMVSSLALSSDGRWVAAGYYDDSIQIWDSASRELIKVLKEHTGAVASLAFSPDNSLIASASTDYSIRIWALPPVTLTIIIRDPSMSFTAISFSPNGNQIVSGSHDGSIHVWPVESPPISESLTTPEDIVQHTQKPELAIIEAHRQKVTQVIFSSDGSRIASLSCVKYDYWPDPSSQIFISNAETGTYEEVIQESVSGASILFHDNNLSIVTVDEHRQLRYQVGERSRTWILPSSIGVDSNTPMALRALGSGNIRVVLASKRAGLVTLDLTL